MPSSPQLHSSHATDRAKKIAETMNEVIGYKHEDVSDVEPSIDQHSDTSSQDSAHSSERSTESSHRGRHSHPRLLLLTLLLCMVEFMWMFGICAEGLLSGEPFPVHVVGMVAATLLWNFGSAIGGHRRAHALLQLTAAIAASIGYAGVFIAHSGAPKPTHDHGGRRTHGAHALALTHVDEFLEKPWDRQLHIVIGYAVLFWSVLQVCSGLTKVIVQRPILKSHGLAGRGQCVVACLQVVLGIALMKYDWWSKFAMSSILVLVTIFCFFMRWHKATSIELRSLD